MDEIELHAGPARAAISTLGAECRAWSVEGQELLWTPDPAIWDAVAPVLFPVCGWTRNGRMRIGGRTYPLGLHGFARSSTFEVAARTADEVQLVLRDDPATRRIYPFAFDLTVTYRLEARALRVGLAVRNMGAGALPYAVGLHPGFRIDPARAAVIHFDEVEDPNVPVIAPGGLFSPRRRVAPVVDRRLDIGPGTFAQEALCFVPARSRGVVLEQGGSRLRVEAPDFDNLVLWSRPGAAFLCIEPWTGYGDPEGFVGELSDKPGMRVLAPGGSAEHRARYILQANPASSLPNP